jgi:hypothetical protein
MKMRNIVLLQQMEKQMTNPPTTSFPKEVTPPEVSKENAPEDTTTPEKKNICP